MPEQSVMLECDKYFIAGSFGYHNYLIEVYYSDWDGYGNYSVQITRPNGDIETYGDFTCTNYKHKEWAFNTGIDYMNTILTDNPDYWQDEELTGKILTAEEIICQE